MVENTQTQIKSWNGNTYIGTELEKGKFENYCDDRNVELNGMEFHSNCAIKIGKRVYNVDNDKFVDRFFYIEEKSLNFTEELNSEEIVVKNIKILKLDKNITIVTSSLTVFILIFITILLVLFWKHKTMSISLHRVREKIVKGERIVDNSQNRRGEDMEPHLQLDELLHSL